MSDDNFEGDASPNLPIQAAYTSAYETAARTTKFNGHATETPSGKLFGLIARSGPSAHDKRGSRTGTAGDLSRIRLILLASKQEAAKDAPASRCWRGVGICSIKRWPWMRHTRRTGDQASLPVFSNLAIPVIPPLLSNGAKGMFPQKTKKRWNEWNCSHVKKLRQPSVETLAVGDPHKTNDAPRDNAASK